MNFNWWNREVNKSAAEEKKNSGEKLNRRERRLLRQKEDYGDVGQSFASAVARGSTLNPYAVRMAKEWRKKNKVKS